MSDTTNTPVVEEVVPRNLAAILDWCLKYRQDLYAVVWAERRNDGFILMMTIGFEAGRHFQNDNPTYPLNASHLYLEQAVVMTERKKVEGT